MKEKLISILAEIKNDSTLEEKITESTDIVNDLGIDSLQMINLILKVEEEFGIQIDFDNFQISDLSSVKNFCEFISQRV